MAPAAALGEPAYQQCIIPVPDVRQRCSDKSSPHRQRLCSLLSIVLEADVGRRGVYPGPALDSRHPPPLVAISRKTGEICVESQSIDRLGRRGA